MRISGENSQIFKMAASAMVTRASALLSLNGCGHKNAGERDSMDEGIVAAAGLLEAAQNNQKTVEAAIQKLEALIKLLQELPRNVTPELRAAVEKSYREELAATRQEFQSLTTNLRYARERIGRAWLQVGGSVVLTAVLAVGAVLAYVLPSAHEIEALRAQKAVLEASVADLTSRGGRIHLKTCANAAEKPRLCALVDPGAGTYGTAGERYMVLKGY